MAATASTHPSSAPPLPAASHAPVSPRLHDSQCCFVLVWVEGRDTPVYACESRLPLHPSTTTTSPASCTTAGSDAALDVNVVALRRFFAALRLLRSPPGERSVDAAPVTYTALPCGLSAAYGAAPPHYSAAVLSPRLCIAGSADAEQLMWLTTTVLAALLPASWSMRAAAPSTTASLGAAHTAGVLPRPAMDADDMAARLCEYGAAAVAAAQAAAAAMETYGVRDVVADAEDLHCTLAAVVAQTAAVDTDTPVARAVHRLLQRCWTPLSAPPITHRSGGPLTTSHGLRLVGYFTIPLPSLHPHTAEGTRRGASPPAVTGATSTCVRHHACAPGFEDALRVIASVYTRCPRPEWLRHTTLTDATALLVWPICPAAALLAARVGCTPCGSALHQVVRLTGLPARVSNTGAPHIHLLPLATLSACGTPWHVTVLHQIFN
ncbi:hypothetical protein NESM_000805000 [Novymonas esmeraldas]|uniref:Uncharacterized protein n=1 Tax=Novymonas esmeraldas TaxID=1808958 RepID=A0AAW0EZK6_9TRYP